MKFHTYECDYEGHNLASTAVTLYYSGVGYTHPLSICKKQVQGAKIVAYAHLLRHHPIWRKVYATMPT